MIIRQARNEGELMQRQLIVLLALLLGACASTRDTTTLAEELEAYHSRDLEEALELPAGREFDYVVISDVIEHLRNRVDLFVAGMHTCEVIAVPSEDDLPFVTGPHKCLGHQFAKMQMKLVVARLVSTFEFRKPEGMQFKHKMRLTLRAEPPVTLQVKRCEFKRPEVEYPQV